MVPTRPASDTYRPFGVDALVSDGGAALVWRPLWALDGSKRITRAAFRVSDRRTGEELAIYDNLTAANDAAGELNRLWRERAAAAPPLSED